MKETFIKWLNNLGLAYWVEIITDRPNCIYYFGPFLNLEEATSAQAGYIEDLQSEAAQGMKVTIKRCKPNNLTVCDDFAEPTHYASLKTFSGQPS
jgi:hypothetical protein